MTAEQEARELLPLPCPFCGKVPTDIEEYHGHYHSIPTYYVNCMTCDIAIYGKGREGAIEAWNRRPADTAATQAYRDEVERLRAALADFLAAAPHVGDYKLAILACKGDALDAKDWTAVEKYRTARDVARAALNPKAEGEG